jgi:hypothetical protein
MSSEDTAGPTEILYCRCAWAQVVPQETKQSVLDGLCRSGQPFRAVADLCEMAARQDPALRELASGSCRLRVAACFPRAVKGLFRQAGADLNGRDVEILNMREEEASAIVERLLAGEAPLLEDGEDA